MRGRIKFLNTPRAGRGHPLMGDAAVILSVPQLVTMMVTIITAFVAIFVALQRYVGNRVDGGIKSLEEHADRFEGKLGEVVKGLSDLKSVLSHVSGNHSARLDAISGRVDRIESSIERLSR